MSFVGCIGILMNNSGLNEIFEKCFLWLRECLQAKIIPMNVTALRYVVLELLRDYIEDMGCYDDLLSFLS